MLNNRLRRRLFHHILIGVGSVALTVIFMHFFPKRDFISQLKHWDILRCAISYGSCVAVGPLNVLCQKPNPVSFDLRRDLGIWAGITALVHTAAGLNVHLRGRMWLYSLILTTTCDETLSVRKLHGRCLRLWSSLCSWRRLTNSLRWLGVGRWKSLQRWAYASAALTGAHTIAYQYVEKRSLPFRRVFTSCFWLFRSSN